MLSAAADTRIATMRDGSLAETSSRAACGPNLLGIEGLDEAVEVGRGGFAVVYRARQDRFGRTVAVKLLDPGVDMGLQRRFERECRAMGALSWHPNIVIVHEAGVNVARRPYLVMEYLERGTLRDRLSIEGPLPWKEVAVIGLELGSAVRAAHESGVLHRDVKPDNVLVGSSGECKLADFGLAEIRDASLGSVQQFGASIAHVAPEVVRGDRASEASDVYSLASTMFELLVSRPAYVEPADQTLASALSRLLEGDLPDLGQLAREAGVECLPPELCVSICRAMADDPRDRLDLAELVGDLRELLGPGGMDRVNRAVPPIKNVAGPPTGGASLTLPPPLGEHPRKGRRRLVAAGTAVVALLVAATWVFALGGRGDPPAADVAGTAVESDPAISLRIVEEQSFDVGARTADIAVSGQQLFVGTEGASIVAIDLESGTVGPPIQVGEMIDLESVAASVPQLTGHPDADEVVNAVSFIVPREDDLVVTRLYGVFSADPEKAEPAEPLVACVPLGAVEIDRVVYVPCAPLIPGVRFAMLLIGESGDAPVRLEVEDPAAEYSGAVQHEGDLWILDLNARAVLRFDVDDRRVDEASRIDQLAVGEGAVMHSAFGYLWITASEGGDLLRIDTSTGTVDELELGANPRNMADGDGLLWVADTEGDELILVEPTGELGPESVVARFNVAEPDMLVYQDGGVWVGSGADVLRVEYRG